MNERHNRFHLHTKYDNVTDPDLSRLMRAAAHKYGLTRHCVNTSISFDWMKNLLCYIHVSPFALNTTEEMA